MIAILTIILGGIHSTISLSSVNGYTRPLNFNLTLQPNVWAYERAAPSSKSNAE